MHRRAWTAGILGVLLGATVSPLPARAEIGPGAGLSESVTALPQTTWQTNGTVWDMEIVNGVVYVGGTFTSVRPPGAALGTNEVPRAHLAAFDAKTGNLLNWAPKATANPWTVPAGVTPDPTCTPLGNNQVECATVFSLAVTPDTSTLVAGGDFGLINGSYRPGLAAFSIATGALSPTFRPVSTGRVYSAAATNTAVFAGGPFTRFNNQVREGLASVALPSGDLLPFTATVTPSTAAVVGGVRAIALTQDGARLIVGGGFDKINGTAIHGLAAVDTTTGASARWDAKRIFSAAFVTSVNVYGNTAYSTADALGSTSEGVIAYDASTGAEQWYDSCRGASHSMAVVREVVYVGSHSHDCGVMVDSYGEQYQGYASGDRRRYTLRAEVPAGAGKARMLHWFPRTNDGNGARAMATDGKSLWIGGEFTSVDSVNQQGLTHFSFLDQGGVDHKPLTPVGPKVSSTRPGVVNVSWRQTEDPDGAELEYQLIKDGNSAAPIYTVKSSGKPWLQGWITYEDRKVLPGEVHRYDVRAVDSMGTRSNRSTQTSVTVASSFVSAGALAKADGAVAQYSFEGTTAGKFVDGVAGRTATPGSGVSTTNVTGTASTGNAVLLSGSSGGVIVDGLREYTSRSFTVEAMLSTTTTRGGVIASMGDSSSTTSVSGSNVGTLYMDNQGRLNWGVMPDTTRADVWTAPSSSRQAITTVTRYNDGQWHHVVATFEPTTGLQIFVDGTLVANEPKINWSRSVNAYLRIGGDRIASWPNTPTSAYFNGKVDEVALYRHPLTDSQISNHADVMLLRLGKPSSLSGVANGPTSVTLTWSPVVGATGYEVSLGGDMVGTSTTPSFTDSGLTASTTYSYTVKATNGAASGPASDSVSVKTSPPPPQGLLASGYTWRYETSGVTTTGWTDSAFDDSAWPTGPTQIGHGEGDEATAITPFGSDGVTRRITTYLRTDFVLADASAVTSLPMRIKRDDGVIVYLNGTEVYRDLMPAGAVTSETLAKTYAPDDGQKWITATLPKDALVSGKNVLAVEIHQNARSSLDLSFDMELSAAF